MLVGAYGAGKTSTKRSLFNEPYETKHLSTDGADVYSIDITKWIIKECTTDYKGHKSVEPTQKLLGDVLVSGMTEMEYGHREHPATKAEVANVLNAVKLEGERISDVFTRLGPYKLVPWMRKREESDVYFSLWDFAGQSIYYITHQVFLSSRVIYILVTDLTKSLDDTLPVDDVHNWKIKEFLTFWMNSIHTHASPGPGIRLKQLDGSYKMATEPPVIILGTKKDLIRKENSTEAAAAIDGEEREAQKRLLEIKEFLRKHATQVVNNHVINMIAIDNKSRKEDGTIADPAVETLREKLQQLAKEYFFLGKVKAKWIHLELSLKKLQKQKVSLDEVKKFGKELKMEEAEVMKALEFYHDIGEILYFGSIPEMENTVILDVEWLVNLFTILITKSITYKKDLDAPSKINGLIDELHNEGRLHEELVDYILKRHEREEDKTILMKMMELYDIICEMPTNPKKEKSLYYLPSLLQKDAEGKNSIIFPANSSVHCHLYIHFVGNFLPEGLFYRLLVRCLKRWPESIAVIRKHKARLYFPKEEFYITMCKEDADIQLKILSIPAGDQHSPPPQSRHVSNVRKLIEEELRVVVKTYTPNLVYHPSFKCQCPNHRVGELLQGSEDADDKCVPLSGDKSSGVCPRSGMLMKDRKLDMWYWTGESSSHSIT
ncbi:probable serine/threonine-protein kinase pats1 [Ptychodera flava]|uniref:probable serine/threonine-protein kinase pats1 n=1 Tax=Ptychodera flava TaxID=63121 RepID=UPI00396A5EDF